MRDPVLSTAERAFLASARRAVLATIAPDGRPRPVPVCFVLDPVQAIAYTPLDEKPKTVADPLELARTRDVLADARVTILVDRWDEDWSRLAWVRAQGRAILLPPGQADAERVPAIAGLRAKYVQYASHDLESRPIIRIDIERVTSWGAL